jgi:hypothetical protein
VFQLSYNILNHDIIFLTLPNAKSSSDCWIGHWWGYHFSYPAQSQIFFGGISVRRDDQDEDAKDENQRRIRFDEVEELSSITYTLIKV